MPYEIYPTTAENIISATDAALQKVDGVAENLVAEFMDTTPNYARDALGMAKELALLQEQNNGTFIPNSRCSIYLCTAIHQSKAAILRFLLEQYLPYQTFKSRLELTGVVGAAASQTKALHQITAHRQVIMDTFCSLGTYAQSLTSEGGGLYRVNQDSCQTFLGILNQSIQDRETAAIQVRKRLGDIAVSWVDEQNVLENLITAYQRAGTAAQDARAPIVHAGNAVESFLSRLAQHHSVGIQNAHGINAKADALARAGHINDKHKFMIKYLGHIRNAADHGIDATIGTQWTISENTAIEYVHVAQSIISDMIASLNGEFII